MDYSMFTKERDNDKLNEYLYWLLEVQRAWNREPRVRAPWIINRERQERRVAAAKRSARTKYGLKWAIRF